MSVTEASPGCSTQLESGRFFFFLSSWTEAEFGTYFVKVAESLVIFDFGNRGKKINKTQNNQIHWSRSKFAGKKKASDCHVVHKLYQTIN